MTTVVLNVKIDAELKEKLRHYAEENNENLGTATEKLLQLAFQLEASAGEAGVTEEDIDSQHTEEEATPLTPKEIKALRKLLKKKK
ncbi:hypothetical protein AB9D95_14085 [Klebsiella africana]|uniref:Uncharacterized protein n=2 Tax=Klebsiella africana TaxID=2489010 RepID=A0ACD4AK44_9ENTR|nr:hypothetical protein [Klebsiella africana]QRF11541.1 hypothetical protein H1X61_19230 [Klebsiella africana]UDD39316.1 hypothetical protein LGL98_19245 [Klebsiella africana]USB40092.1 hypothetical protein KU660_19085 [Klebsiella africana]VGP79272.1 hypothetical protein SB5857_01099 [Klebsiella africana]